ncbi:hypothetical protein BgiMline_024041, partial [Biomphalaria glabrata]
MASLQLIKVSRRKSCGMYHFRCILASLSWQHWALPSASCSWHSTSGFVVT